MLRKNMRQLLVGVALLATSNVLYASTAALQKLESALAGLSTMQAAFDQRIISSDRQLLDQVVGQFYLSRPGRFKWQPDGEGLQTVSDGRSIYVYDPSLETVHRFSVKRAVERVPTLVLIAKDVNLDELFTIQQLTDAAGLQWYQLLPKSEQATYQSIRLGFAGPQLVALSFVDALGQTTQLQFSNIRSGQVLSDDLFKFEVPPGADLVGDN